MRLLWFNWRDINNPEAGGAEVLTQEIATRLVRKFGCQVTIFTSQFDNADPRVVIDGVEVIRAGGKIGVYNKAVQYYRKHKDSFHLIIDEINVKPFLTPKFVKEKPIVALIHQISPEQFSYELPLPFGIIGRYYLEKKWLSYYRHMPTVTVSDSTKGDLQKLGYTKIFLIPEGLNVTPLTETPPKESVPTFVFIGRLKKHKLPHHAIQAFSFIKQELPDAKLWVIGDGYMRKKLESLEVQNIKFFGRIGNKKKYELLSRAHMILVPAIREGWGLVVTESNAMGTPAVAYNVPGLRDSVKDGQTGLLVSKNTPKELASGAISLFKDALTLSKFSANAIDFSKQFTWDRTTEIFYHILLEQIQTPITTSCSLQRRTRYA
jgi:glycosyltransferase involved in cell wall biosynthesis